MLEVKRIPHDGRVPAASTNPTPAAPALASVPNLAETTSAISPAQPRVTAPLLVQPTGSLKEQQTRIPVIVGEAHFKGMLPVDGVLSGQLGASCSLNVRQKSRVSQSNEAELSGEVTFRGMVRVNGHISGTVYSEKGTLIVDASARVDGKVEVGAAVISGQVYGDIVAHEKVEIGPNAKIYGNIWTRSIEIKDGAIFEGICRMIS